MDVFLFVASKGSQGHLTSALKHDLTKDCITAFNVSYTVCQSQSWLLFST